MQRKNNGSEMLNFIYYYFNGHQFKNNDHEFYIIFIIAMNKITSVLSDFFFLLMPIR